jgi:hypothetical protein
VATRRCPAAALAPTFARRQCGLECGEPGVDALLVDRRDRGPIDLGDVSDDDVRAHGRYLVKSGYLDVPSEKGRVDDAAFMGMGNRHRASACGGFAGRAVELGCLLGS